MSIGRRPPESFARGTLIRDRVADLILSLAIYGGREGTGVCAEDRDSEAYLDCQNAADGILRILPTEAFGAALDIAEAQIGAVMGLHVADEQGTPMCVECGYAYPCRTSRIFRGEENVYE